MIIHSPIISGSLTFADGATFTLPDNGVYSGSFSGSLQVHQVQSHLVPDTAFTYDLGSATYPFRDLYISTGSLKGMKPGGEVAFKLSSKPAGGLKVTDANDEAVEIEAKEITLKDPTGNGNNIKLKVQDGALKSTIISNDDVENTASEPQTLQSNISGSLIVTGSTTLQNTTIDGTVDTTGLASLDGGIDVDGAFTVADTTGNVSTTGTLAAGNTTITGTVDATGLISADGGLDVDGAFTVSDTTGNVSTTGTLAAGNTTITGDISVSTSGSFGALNVTTDSVLGGGLDVTGNTNITGTLTAGATEVLGLTISGTEVTSTAVELNLLDGSTAGTVTNSKAVVYGSGGEVNATKLQVGGVDITSTPAELNLLDGVAGLVQADFTKLAAIEVDATKINYLTDMTGNVKNYIDTEVAGIVDTAPEALNTLNELAAALGDDPNFATTISTTIGGKVSQSLSLSAGNGLTGGGNLTADRTFDVVGTVDRITVSADAVDIASTYVGQSSITTLGTITTGVWNGTAIGNTYIAADAIDGTKIADDAINSEHIADGAIDTVHIADLNVTTGKIADAAVTSAKLAGSYTGTWAVTGAITATGDITAYASSDERLKDNIEVISNPIEKVQQLKGVTWDWNDNASEVQHSLPNVGVIAQDVEKVLPQLVRDNEGGYKAVDYDKLVGLLIEAIKDQQKQIDDLKSKI